MPWLHALVKSLGSSLRHVENAAKLRPQEGNPRAQFSATVMNPDRLAL
jgi:hypothetical protein